MRTLNLGARRGNARKASLRLLLGDEDGWDVQRAVSDESLLETRHESTI